MANVTGDYYQEVRANQTFPTDRGSPGEETTTSGEYLPNWTDLVLAALFLTLIVVTIVGNTLVIAAVITTRRLRSVTNCFVSSLAAADLLVGLAVMPPAVLLQLNGGSWELGDLLCDFWVSLDVLLCTASILSLCAISIDRYLAVTQPLIYSRRRRSKRLAGLMIVVVWILAGAITGPPLLGCFPRTREYDSRKCSYNMDSSYVIFSAMGSFFLPMLVMLYVYGRISCVIAGRHRSLETSDTEGFQRRRTVLRRKPRKSECNVSEGGGSDSGDRQCMEPEMLSTMTTRKFGTNATSTTTTTTTTMTPSRGQHPHQHHHQQQSCINRVVRETKTAGTLAVVVGGFVACWLPFFVLYLATPFIPMEPPEILMPALTWLGWINSAINPFIYAFYSADFRLAFWRLTCRRCSKRRSANPRHRAERKLTPAASTWQKNTRT